MTITQQRIAVPALDDAWDLYAALFTDIDTLAAQRHLMTYAEFADVYHNPDVLKFYCYDDRGQPIGMSVLTRELEAWPLISPRYFARHFPDFYYQKSIWYVGFVGVKPHHLHGFRELVRLMYPYISRSDGIAVMDFCAFNTTIRRIPEVTLRLLSSINPAAGMQTVDAQTFIAYRFDQIGQVG